MKYICLIAMLAAMMAHGEAEPSPLAPLPATPQADPTRPAEEMVERLKTLVTDSPSLRLRALVVGAARGAEGRGAAGESGVALVGDKMVRPGSVIVESLDGVKVELPVEAVNPSGVLFRGGARLDAALQPEPAPGEPSPEMLRHLESDGVAVALLMRMISSETGVNIAVSDAASRKEVSIFLRGVTVPAAVEEICRATGLWFRREGERGIIRVMTMKEYSDNLATFREETTEMFTLLYPNVIEVASVIYGIYPDRTLVSLGEEEFDEDDEYDLSRRFRRFRVIEDNGGSQFMGMESPQVTSSGSRSGNGTFSFSRGGVTGRLSQWDELRRRSRGNRYGTAYADSGVGYDNASLIENAQHLGDTNLVDKIRTQAMSSAGANIFVSLSRKNNMLIVRTSDRRVMDEIRALVKRLDVPTPMVLMEVKVLELSVDDDYEASFTYSFNRGTHTLGHNGSGSDNILADIAQGAQNAMNPTFAFKAVSDNITAQIKLLQQDGKIKTLATPSLLVANNEVARIFSGKEYPLVSGWSQGDTVVADSGIVKGSSTVEITKEDVGTMLLITPNINADKTVTLRLLQENSEVSPDKVLIPVDGSGGESKEIEYVESRSLAGTFIASDGMTIMAGGLVKETEGETYWRTPILGSLPLVGWLFRGTERVKERTELIVLIKPHVILTPLEGGKISSDLMKALSAHPAADGRDSIDVHKPDVPHNLLHDLENMTK